MKTSSSLLEPSLCGDRISICCPFHWARWAVFPFSPGAANDMSRAPRRGIVDLSLRNMDDEGMWVWAGILTLVGLVASLAIAAAWQRWKDKKKEKA